MEIQKITNKITAYNCDCMEYMKDIPDKYYDLAIVDPPYGINAPNMTMGSNMNRKHGGYNGESVVQRLKKGRLNQGSGKLKNRVLNTMSCEWDFYPPDKEYFNELFRVSKNQIIWGGNYFNLPPCRCFVCWDKVQPWENFSQAEFAWTSFDKPSKIVRISTTGGNNKEIKIHPTQKPVRLYKYLLKKFADPSFKIYDSHFGSLNIGIACHDFGCQLDACEIDAYFFNQGVKQVKEYTRQLSFL